MPSRINTLPPTPDLLTLTYKLLFLDAFPNDLDSTDYVERWINRFLSDRRLSAIKMDMGGYDGRAMNIETLAKLRLRLTNGLRLQNSVVDQLCEVILVGRGMRLKEKLDKRQGEKENERR